MENKYEAYKPYFELILCQMFGVVQGGENKFERLRSADFVASQPVFGIFIPISSLTCLGHLLGGFGLDETEEQMNEMIPLILVSLAVVL